MLSVLKAADAPNPTDLVRHALPWVLEASNPYYRVLFGSANLTQFILNSWLQRATSEVSIQRVQFLISESEFAGGFIALGGGELRKTRKADSIALLTSVTAKDLPGFPERLANLAGLFPSVADDEFYLSKAGVIPQFRGKSLGHFLIDRYLEEGMVEGYTRYRLDVHVDNEAAIHCYSSAGFKVFECTESRDGMVRYYSMKCERRGI